MSRHTAISLSDQVSDRLLALAARTGRTPKSDIEEALKEHLEDLEDIDLAERALERHRRGESRTYYFEEVGREIGLEDSVDKAAVRQLRKMPLERPRASEITSATALQLWLIRAKQENR